MERNKRTCQSNRAAAAIFAPRVRWVADPVSQSPYIGYRRARTAAGALQKATQPTSAVHTWHCLVTRYLSQKYWHSNELRQTCKSLQAAALQRQVHMPHRHVCALTFAPQPRLPGPAHQVPGGRGDCGGGWAQPITRRHD